MFRFLLVAIVLTFLACDRGQGPTTPAVPDDGSFTTLTAAADDDAGGGGSLHSDDVQASVIITHIHVKSRQCDAQDGHYFEGRSVFTGTSVGDPRLSGQFEFAVIQDLFNATQLNGPQRANIEIRDPVTGRKKAEGATSAWGPADFVQGTIVGAVRDEGGGSEETSGSGRLIANFRLTYHANGAVSIQIGGATTDNQLPAGIWRSGCAGAKYAEFDVDPPAPGVGAAGNAAISGRTWRSGRMN